MWTHIVSLRDIASPLQVSVDQSSDCDIGPSSCQRGRVVYWTSETGHKLPLRERLLLCEADVGDLRKPSRQATSRSGRCRARRRESALPARTDIVGSIAR